MPTENVEQSPESDATYTAVHQDDGAIEAAQTREAAHVGRSDTIKATREREAPVSELANAAEADEFVTVAMGFDSGYVPHVAAVLASIGMHAPGAAFRFIMLHSGVSETMKRRLEKVAPGSEFAWRAVGHEVPAFADREHFTRATLFRLALDVLAPAECRRVIYLDADLIVVDDIRRLWAFDLGDALLAAVSDEFLDAEAFAAKWGLPPGPDYFNAGVLLIDLERVRAASAFSRALSFYARHGPDLPWNDQDALNWACWGRWAKLEMVWNVQQVSAIEYANGVRDRFDGEAPRIIHYTGPQKPWAKAGYHPWPWLYWSALARTDMFEHVASSTGFNWMLRFRLWLRWLRRRPRLVAKSAGDGGREKSASLAARTGVTRDAPPYPLAAGTPAPMLRNIDQRNHSRS